MVHASRRNLAHLAKVTVVAAVLGSTSGCGTTAPCLNYQPMMLTKTVSMRGHGVMRVTSEEMVCTERAEIIESVATAN